MRRAGLSRAARCWHSAPRSPPCLFVCSCPRERARARLHVWAHRTHRRTL
jgi:hypothetical protein